MFEEEYGKFLEEQRRTANGRRLEMLNKDLTGEKKLIKEILWPVLKSFDGLILQHEIISLSGVRIYIDVFYEPPKFAFECEGFVVHAENITRDRFDFEKMRVRTMVTYGYKYIPFSWDELDKKPEFCRRSLYEMMGRFSNKENGQSELTVHERELIRYVLRLNRPFRLSDACSCLQMGAVACRKIIRLLIAKKLIKPLGNISTRNHQYSLEEKAVESLY